MGRLQLWARGGLHGAVLGTGAGDGRGTPARGTWHGCPNICVQVNPPLLPLTPVTPQGQLPKSCLGTPQPAAGGSPATLKLGLGLVVGTPMPAVGVPAVPLCFASQEPSHQQAPRTAHRGSAPCVPLPEAGFCFGPPPGDDGGGSRGGLGCSPARHGLVLHACSISAFPCIRVCGMNI